MRFQFALCLRMRTLETNDPMPPAMQMLKEPSDVGEWCSKYPRRFGELAMLMMLGLSCQIARKVSSYTVCMYAGGGGRSSGLTCAVAGSIFPRVAVSD